METYGPSRPSFATLPRLQLRFNDMVVRLLIPQFGGRKAATQADKADLEAVDETLALLSKWPASCGAEILSKLLPNPFCLIDLCREVESRGKSVVEVTSMKAGSMSRDIKYYHTSSGRGFLVSCGDIEMNPGPRSVFNCSVFFPIFLFTGRMLTSTRKCWRIFQTMIVFN